MRTHARGCVTSWLPLQSLRLCALTDACAWALIWEAGRDRCMHCHCHAYAVRLLWDPAQSNYSTMLAYYWCVCASRSLCGGVQWRVACGCGCACACACACVRVFFFWCVHTYVSRWLSSTHATHHEALRPSVSVREQKAWMCSTRPCSPVCTR